LNVTHHLLPRLFNLGRIAAMNKVAIVTDSTAYLPKDWIEQYHISIIPLTVVWGDEILRDGIDIQPAKFYERLLKSKLMPTTSQVTPAAMMETFQPLLEQGYDVLSIFLSSKFSGTGQSAIQARDMIDGGAQRIAIVDSFLTTMAMGWPVLTAARAAQAGEDLAECQKVAENACKNSGVLFVVETLEFLRRGGRIGGASALLGTALNIKPVLEMRDGKIESVEKIRTKQKAIQRMLDLATERIDSRTPVRVAVTHANSEADASSLLQQASERFNPVETIISPLSPVIGTHAGPGTVALNYMVG
jgi:DegV family protein with EDD domain